MKDAMYSLLEIALLLTTPVVALCVWRYSLKPGNAGVLILGEVIVVGGAFELYKWIEAERLRARKQRLER